MECIENAVQKVMDENIDEIEKKGDRRFDNLGRFADDKVHKPKSKGMGKTGRIKGNKGNQNWDLDQVAESAQPRRRKK